MDTPKIIFFASYGKLLEFYEKLWDNDPVDGVPKEKYMRLVWAMSGGYSKCINTIGISLPNVLLYIMIQRICVLNRENDIVKYISHIIAHEMLHYLIDEFSTQFVSVETQHYIIKRMGCLAGDLW